jgi:SAM-dependent methyltransferase
VPDRLKILTTPIQRYFNARFEALNANVDALRAELRTSPSGAGPGLAAEAPGGVDVAELQARARQADYLHRVDVAEHNRLSAPTTFTSLDSRAASAAECDDPTYLAWWRSMMDIPADYTYTPEDEGVGPYNRKVWEWGLIAEAVSSCGLMSAGHSALGFGVGNEPLPALFAGRGMTVLATDQSLSTADQWAVSGQLLQGLHGLCRPHLVADVDLARLVGTREVDMNEIPADIGMFDVVWSSCAIEHLGSPRRGLDFVLETCELLKPGGIAVHTTELELTPKAETADYGHCAVYRIEDLQDLEKRVRDAGYDVRLNFHVAMETPADRWISLLGTFTEKALPEPAHLKLVIGDSVSTSYGLIIRKV